VNLASIIDWGAIKVGDLPAYLGFIAAALAAVFAGLTWHKQKGLINEQLAELLSERAKRAYDEERQQAIKISGWHEYREAAQELGSGTSDTQLVMLNTSDEPVYDIMLTLVALQGTSPRTGEEYKSDDWAPRRHFGVLPPGKFVAGFGSGWGHMGFRPGAEIAFTDRNGKHWIRRSGGALEGIAKNAREHYKMHGPYPYSTPDSAS
jgi:hypothetical protein